MQRVDNFGSLLQSYSLKKMIESLGHEVSFIDIQKKDNDNILMENNSVIFADEIEGKRNLFSKLSKIDRYVINRIRNKKKMHIQLGVFEEFRKNVLNISETDNRKKYDICVIGSDEVFNCCTKSSWGFTSQLFGNVEQADKVITYAASCGSTRYEDLSVQVIDRIKQAFHGISAMSVRDENTKKFVNMMTEQEVYMNLDPVVIADFQQEIAESNKVILSSRYCIVYSYHNRIHKKHEIDVITKFCKDKSLELVSIGAPQKWIKNHMVLNPFEVIVAFSNADFVFTDTFHGTIFSAKYAKRFATMARESNKNKLLDLVKRLSIGEHLIDNIYEIENKYEIINDTEQIKQIEKIERKKAIDYLKSNL